MEKAKSRSFLDSKIYLGLHEATKKIAIFWKNAQFLNLIAGCISQ